MRLKRIILVGALLGFTGLSFAANADTLDTFNYTDHDSAVVITSGINKGKCTGTLPAPLTQYTPAGTPTNPGESHVAWTSVGALCLGSGGACTADIHMTKDCSDAVYAQVSLNTSTHVITVTGQASGSPYSVTAAGNALSVKMASSK